MNSYAKKINFQTGAQTITAPANFPVKRFVVSLNKLSATTGTVDVTIRARGMTDAHAPANNQFDLTAADRQKELSGGDVGAVILTPASVDSAIDARVEFFSW